MLSQAKKKTPAKKKASAKEKSSGEEEGTRKDSSEEIKEEKSGTR